MKSAEFCQRCAHPARIRTRADRPPGPCSVCGFGGPDPGAPGPAAGRQRAYLHKLQALGWAQTDLTTEPSTEPQR